MDMNHTVSPWSDVTQTLELHSTLYGRMNLEEGRDENYG